MRNVLMVAYDFPPLGGSGVQRTLKYAKYLPEFGWNPIILTVRKDVEKIESADLSFMKEISNSVIVYRSNIIEPYDIYRMLGGKHKQFSHQTATSNAGNFFTILISYMRQLLFHILIPDFHVTWYPTAVKKARYIFKNHSIDAIYSTSPKNTCHLIAKQLSKRYTKPWVADFRDPWHDFRERTMFFRKLNELLEYKVLSAATRITFAWPGILTDIKERYTRFNQNKADLITNGFDLEDFQEVTPKKFKHFTITYTGRILIDRNPEALFKAVSILIKEKPKLQKLIKLLFITPVDPILTDLIDKYDLSDVVTHLPYMPHIECISYLLGSHLLYLDTRKSAVPGKLFEYIGLRKPILAFASNDSTVADIVNSTKSGVVINMDSIEEIKNIIYAFFQKHKEPEHEINGRINSAILKYERKELTRKLADILNEIS